MQQHRKKTLQGHSKGCQWGIDTVRTRLRSGVSVNVWSAYISAEKPMWREKAYTYFKSLFLYISYSVRWNMPQEGHCDDNAWVIVGAERRKHSRVLACMARQQKKIGKIYSITCKNIQHDILGTGMQKYNWMTNHDGTSYAAFESIRIAVHISSLA